MPPNHVITAKVLILLSAGVLVGYAFGVSMAHDAEKGRAITLKEYVADFDAYKAKLVSTEMPMPVAIGIGLVMILLPFGAYELIAFGLAKGLAAAGRRLSRDVP